MIQQGGISANDEIINAFDKKYSKEDLQNGVIIKKGKSSFEIV